jgi:acyl-[acyl-carrier-protein] desaturase
MIDKQAIRRDVMQHLEPFVQENLSKFLKPIDSNWQPSDFLPDSREEGFLEKISELQEKAKELPYDFWITLIGDTITEEALPTYESALFSLDNVNHGPESPWAIWTKGWTSEENRHGDLLNKYLYLSGRVNMREMEVSTQYLLADGFNIQTNNDPYRVFIYTSFQELATMISHKRVSSLAKAQDNDELAKMCTMIAADEGRHAHAYKSFVTQVFEADPNEMMLAFADMMKKKIVMPAHYMRETGVAMGETFEHFSNAAQRLGVYTSEDYVGILDILLKYWKIENICNLDESGEKARDYLVKLPSRLTRIAERMTIPVVDYEFSWITR